MGVDMKTMQHEDVEWSCGTLTELPNYVSQMANSFL
jgi:hypothetical protein